MFFVSSILFPFLLSLGIVASTDWTMFGGDFRRTNYNPSETIISKFSGLENGTKTLANKWKLTMNSVSITQPLYLKAASINGSIHDTVFISTESGTFYAVDANVGTILWQRSLGYATDTACNFFTSASKYGVGGTAHIDRQNQKIYVSSNGNIYCLTVSTGADVAGWPLTGQYDPVLYHNYGAMALYNSTLYMTLASHCDKGTYYGQLIAYNTITRTKISTFSPAPASPAYGAGIWGCAGVSVYNSAAGASIYTAVGNTIGSSAENTGYGEHVVKLTPALTVQASYTPGVLVGDGDYGATPVIITPTNQCGTTFTLTQNKGGVLTVTDSNLNIVKNIQISAVSSSGSFISTAAFDPTRNMFYVGNPHATTTGAYIQGLLAFKVFDNCTITKVWNTAITTTTKGVWPSPVVAGGLVFLATGQMSTLYAVDADTGALVWTAPQTLGVIYASPTVVDGHLFVADSGPSYNGQGTFWAYALSNPAPLPTLAPTRPPSLKPTGKPTLKPSAKPTFTPSFKPTAKPVVSTTAPVAVKPSKSSIKPTAVPS